MNNIIIKDHNDVENGQEKILAIHIKDAFDTSGASFFTPNSFPFQLGMHIRPKGTLIDPHQHIPFQELTNLPAKEFIYLVKGKLEVTLYNKKIKHSVIIMHAGDALLLNCGHKVVFLEDCKMLELKQGPYRGRDIEKEFFPG